MPKLYMLVGVPAAGKSTWIDGHNKSAMMVASSDAYLDRIAANQGKTYNDVFADNIKAANQHAHQVAQQAFDLGLDLIWDQTNLNRKSRAPKLAMVPDHYEKIAVYFPTPDKPEHDRRLANRPGKSIPHNILMGMIRGLEKPTHDEGFDEIMQVST
jgi:predicted kinase